MKRIGDEVVAQLASRFALKKDELSFLGGGREDSDGTAFWAVQDGRKLVLKLLEKKPGGPSARNRVIERAEFFSFLGQGGVAVVSPIQSREGNLVEVLESGDGCYLAYAYPYLSGEHPTPKTWNEETLAAWGRVIGKSHRLTKEYPIWDGVILPDTGEEELTWRREIEDFYIWCEDEDVKRIWDLLRQRLCDLPQGRQSVGFIHNDPHMQNVLIDQGVAKLLDFDVANCHFFSCDLAIAIQSVMFSVSGGMDRPVSDEQALVWFTKNLLKGYRMENETGEGVLKEIELFISYRRALLFTVMQDWLKQNKEARASWKQMLMREAEVFKGHDI